MLLNAVGCLLNSGERPSIDPNLKRVLVPYAGALHQGGVGLALDVDECVVLAADLPQRVRRVDDWDQVLVGH